MPKFRALNPIIFLPTLGHLAWLVEKKQEFQNSKFRKIGVFLANFCCWVFFKWNLPKNTVFPENLSFETRVSSQQVMLGDPKLGGTLLGSMHRVWAFSSWRPTFFENIPQMSQNENKSGIFGLIGGNMSWRGTARDKIWFFSCPHRSHLLSKKKGASISSLLWKKYLYCGKKSARVLI